GRIHGCRIGRDEVARRERRTHAERGHTTSTVTAEGEALRGHAERTNVVGQSAHVACLQQVEEQREVGRSGECAVVREAQVLRLAGLEDYCRTRREERSVHAVVVVHTGRQQQVPPWAQRGL